MNRTIKHLIFLAILLLGMAVAQATPEMQMTSTWLKQQSDTQFAKMMAAYLGNPFNQFFGPASQLSNSLLYSIWVIIAQALAVLGFVLSIQRIGMVEGDAMRQFWKAVVTFGLTTALMTWIYVPGQYSIKNVITGSVTTAYSFSVETFGGQVTSKLTESRDAFTEMLGATATMATIVAMPEAGGAMMASTKALAAAAAGGGSRIAVAKAATTAAMPGLKKAGQTAVGFVMEKLGGTMTVLSTFLTGYGALLEAAGWGVLILLLGLPLGLALLNFGQTTVIWTMFGTWMGTIMALLIMPLVLVHAIDTAFVQPVQAMHAYTDTLGAYAAKSQELAAQANSNMQSNIGGALTDCEQATKADPKNIDSTPCAEVANQGFLAKFSDWMTNSMSGLWNQIELTLASIADSFVSYGVLLFRLGAGLVFAALIMFGVPVLAITMFGGLSLRR